MIPHGKDDTNSNQTCQPALGRNDVTFGHVRCQENTEASTAHASRSVDLAATQPHDGPQTADALQRRWTPA